MQRAHRAGLRELCVERVGGGERVRVDHDDRVERRTLLVVRLDPIDVALHQLATGQLLGLERGVDVGDRRFFGPDQVEWLPFGLRSQQQQRKNRGEDCGGLLGIHPTSPW